MLIIIISCLWLIFLLYWTISSKSKKKNTEHNIRKQSLILRIRVRLLIVIMLIWELPIFNQSIIFPPQSSNITQITGIVICAIGIGFAAWARYHLRNEWNGSPAIKEGHRLITSGPYSYVRNPIYTGILFAMLGSAFVDFRWSFVFVICLLTYLYKIKVEETLMSTTFSDQYVEYKKRTKSLIPFLF